MILVTGATGYTGRFLLRRLAPLGRPLRCLVRPGRARGGLEHPGVEWYPGDLEHPEELGPALEGVEKIIHLAPIRYAPALAAAAAGIEQAVLLSSLRRFSRVPSPSVEEVIQGEEGALESGLPCTLLRPAMIYGPGDDRNISRLAAYLRRRRWIPVCGSGRHLQQPVYVEDVVEAILAALRRPRTLGKSYALAGAEALSYNEVIDRVGEAIGVEPRKVHLPLRPALAALWCARALGLRPGLEAAQLRRLQEDKVFSIAAARKDLEYAPLSLREGLARIYGEGA